MMDEPTKKHLIEWLNKFVHPDEQVKTWDGINRVVLHDPGILNTHGWPEIRKLADNGYMEGME